MKKSLTLSVLLLSGAVLLTSCDFLSMLPSDIQIAGGTGSTDSTVIAEVSEGGVETTFVQGLTKAQEAVAKTMAQDTMGIALTIPSLKIATTDAKTSADLSKDENGNVTGTTDGKLLNHTLTINNASLTLNAAGLAAEGAVVTASASLAVNQAIYQTQLYDFNTTKAVDDPRNCYYEVNNATASAYYDGATAYVDASDGNFRSFLNTWLKSESGIPSKASFAGLEKYGEMLRLGVSQYAPVLQDIFKSFINYEAALSQVFTIKDYEDGSSVIYGEFGIRSLAKVVAAAKVAVDANADYNAVINQIMNAYGNSTLDITVAMYYTADGITGLTFKTSGAIVETPEVVVNEDETHMDSEVKGATFDSDIKLAFTYGDKVVVSVPEDLSSYVAY